MLKGELRGRPCVDLLATPAMSSMNLKPREDYVQYLKGELDWSLIHKPYILQEGNRSNIPRHRLHTVSRYKTSYQISNISQFLSQASRCAVGYDWTVLTAGDQSAQLTSRHLEVQSIQFSLRHLQILSA